MRKMIVAIVLALVTIPSFSQIPPETLEKAEAGDASAQYNLALIYDTGTGVPQDFAEAVKWYRMAADQGNASAQYSLGYAYYFGEGVQKDYAEAAKLYRKAADQGNAPAQYNLGIAYIFGRGVPLEYVIAYMLFDLAAVNYGSDKARRDTAVAARDNVADMMTSSEITEAQTRVREWKTTTGK